MLRRFNRPPVRKQKSAARRPLRPRLLVEALEDRCVPASSISNVGGLLTINGDTNAGTNQSVTITEVGGSPGAFTVVVTDNGVAAPGSGQIYAGVSSITVNPTNGGTDTVNLNGAATGAFSLAGNLTINENAQGSLLVDIGSGGANAGTAGFSVTGATQILDSGSLGGTTVSVGGSSTSLGATTIDLGNKASSVTLAGGSTINGALNVLGGTGGDTINLGSVTGTNIGNVKVIGAATLDGGSQGQSDLVVTGTTTAATTTADLTLTNFNNNITIASTTGGGNVTVGGNIFETGGGGANFTMGATGLGATVTGYVSLNVKNADTNPNVSGSFDIAIANSTISQYLSVISGAGADSISVATTTVGSNAGFDLGGAVTKGTTGDTVTLDGTFQGNVFTNGTGSANISIGDTAATSITGYVSLNETGSTSLANVTLGAGGAVNIGQFLSVIASGSLVVNNTEAITLTNVTTGNTFGANLGTGVATMTINGGSIGGNLFVNNSTGNLTFNLGSTAATSVTGYVSLNETGSTSTISATVGAGGAVNVGQFFSVIANGTASGSTDSVSLTNTTLGNNFGVILNAANDVVAMTNVKFNAGGVFVTDTGVSTTTLSGVTATSGLVTLNTGSANYTATVSNSTFGGANITGTGGNENLTFNDDTFNGAVTIRQGSGNDTFIVEDPTEVDTTGSPTQFFGAVDYVGNSSNDTVNLGASATDIAQFFSTASFTSNGATTDSISYKTTATFNQAGQPTIKGFGTQT